MTDNFENKSGVSNLDEIANKIVNMLIEPLASRIIEKLTEAVIQDEKLKKPIESKIDLKRYVNRKELAEYFKVTPPTIDKWMDKYFTAFFWCTYKLGHRILYDARKIEGKVSQNHVNMYKKMMDYDFEENHRWENWEIQNCQERIAFKEKRGWELSKDEITFKERLESGQLKQEQLQW